MLDFCLFCPVLPISCVPNFDRISVLSVINFLRLRPISCVPNFDKISVLSILDCPFGFLERLFPNVLVISTDNIGRHKSNIHSTLRYDLCIDLNQRVIELL